MENSQLALKAAYTEINLSMSIMNNIAVSVSAEDVLYSPVGWSLNSVKISRHVCFALFVEVHLTSEP